MCIRDSPSGGVFFGPVGGVGVVADPSPFVGFFVESTITAHMGLRAGFAQSGAENKPTNVYEPTDFKKYTIGIIGGVQFRL